MNPDFTRKSAMWILTTLGGFLTGWAASRGNQWGDIINQLLSSDTAIGLVALAISAIMTWVTSRLPALVHVMDLIAKDPNTPIKGVVVENSPEGRELAAKVETVVAAGTPAAEVVAKTP